MSISTPFIRRPIATSLLTAGLFIFGLVAYPFLPVAPLPEVDFPTIQVNVNLPGASPDTMASSVASPLERQFSQIAGVTQMTSTSAMGATSITVQFELDRDIDAAAQDIQSAINAAGGQLPKNLPSPPRYRKVNPADAPILLMSVQSDSQPLTVVDDYADTILAQQISQIDGVSQVIIFGQQKPAVRLQVDPAKLANMGLGLEDLRNAIAMATVNNPKGSFDGPFQSFTIYNNDQLLQSSQYQDLIIAYKNAAPIRVRDVGRAVDGPEDTRLASWENGKRGITLGVFRQPGANVIDVVNRINEALPRLRASIPPSIETNILVDRTKTIRASVDDVEITLGITIALVVGVIFLFLRNFWATVIPSITVPLALLGTFAGMYLLTYSLDNLSLMALTISVGFVVDDAIVMIENIMRHIEEGMKPMEAALKGAGEIGFTIISISCSLIAVFIPLLLMGGIVGRLFHEFAITVTLTIVLSAIVSLTLTPMMCSRFLKDERHARHGAVYRFIERGFDAMRDGYARALRAVLNHQFLTLCALLLAIGTTVGLYIAIPKGFFPQQDTGLISGVSEAAQDISFRQMEQKQQALADIIAADPDVADFHSSLGSGGGASAVNVGHFYVSLKPKPGRKTPVDQVIARLRRKAAAVEGISLYLQAAQDINVGGRTSKTQYQYTLQDSDIEELNHWAPLLMARLRTLPELRDVATDQQSSASVVNMTVDRATAARFGIQPQLIDDTLYDAFGQRQVAQFFTPLNQYHVVLEIDPKLQGDPRSLDKIFLKSPITGAQVPLSTFVKIDTTKTNYLSISHQGQFPAVTLSFNLAPGHALGDAVEAVKKAQAELRMPATILGTFQGTAQAFQQSLASTPYLIAAALLAVYIILGVLYESYIHPITILSTLPSAGVGALLILMIFGFDLSVIALIGMILLIGIVKKNAIMMIDFALEAERNQGMTPRESIYHACLIRFRPIMMTTMAAMLGGVPLMLGTGTGAEIRQPLGFAIVGGLALSQVLTLFTTPIVYLYLDRLSHWLKRRRHHARPHQSTAQRILSKAAE